LGARAGVKSTRVPASRCWRRTSALHLPIPLAKQDVQRRHCTVLAHCQCPHNLPLAKWSFAASWAGDRITDRAQEARSRVTCEDRSR
jgi:hypothetical protein